MMICDHADYDHNHCQEQNSDDDDDNFRCEDCGTLRGALALIWIASSFSPPRYKISPPRYKISPLRYKASPHRYKISPQRYKISSPRYKIHKTGLKYHHPSIEYYHPGKNITTQVWNITKQGWWFFSTSIPWLPKSIHWPAPENRVYVQGYTYEYCNPPPQLGVCSQAGLVALASLLSDPELHLLQLLAALAMLVQPLLQTAFLLDASCRTTGTSAQARAKPGRQAVTFLLVIYYHHHQHHHHHITIIIIINIIISQYKVCNLAMWVTSLLETARHEASPIQVSIIGIRTIIIIMIMMIIIIMIRTIIIITSIHTYALVHCHSKSESDKSSDWSALLLSCLAPSFSSGSSPCNAIQVLTRNHLQ